MAPPPLPAGAPFGTPFGGAPASGESAGWSAFGGDGGGAEETYASFSYADAAPVEGEQLELLDAEKRLPAGKAVSANRRAPVPVNRPAPPPRIPEPVDQTANLIGPFLVNGNHWELDQRTMQALGLELAACEQHMRMLGAGSFGPATFERAKRLFATALVLEYLILYSMSRAQTWQSVAQTARAWLDADERAEPLASRLDLRSGWLVHAKEYLLENSSLARPDGPEAQKAIQMIDCVAQRVCTYNITKKDYYPQWYWECSACGLTSGSGLCEACKDRCHAGHTLSAPRFSTQFFCDCGDGKKCQSL
jgi:hypothetical protein